MRSQTRFLIRAETLQPQRQVRRGVVCVLLLFGCQPTNDAVDISDTPVQSVTIIASGDTHGWIMPCGCTANQSGGLLRRGSYVEQQRESGEVILVDVGGAADGTAPYQLERFRAILKGERAMGLVAHNLGSAEIAFGSEILKQLAKETGITFISANVRDSDGQPLATRFVVAEHGGQNVLITGVLSPSFADRHTQISEPADAVLAVIDEAGSGRDRLVVLAYLPPDELRRLAETLPEADVIIGGPTGQSLAPEQVGHVLMTSTTNKGKFLAEVNIPAEVSQPPSAKIVEMSPEWSDHPTQKQNLRAFRQVLAEQDFSADESGLVATQFAVDMLREGRTPAGPRGLVAGTAACRDCHTESCDVWDATGHAHAWQRLMDEDGAHVDPFCQKCHTTGYGLGGGFHSMQQSLAQVNVGCESCHGPSQDHVGDNHRRTPFDAVGSCVQCHDEENSPEFAFEMYWERIQHE